ncbi:MAG: UDP-N-acetylglucosamine 2-epimerase, partial [Bacilli bacterium]|nr:UDP-N-acetylglucosamine 2-epimerase [Bacilli bacterium]
MYDLFLSLKRHIPNDQYKAYNFKSNNYIVLTLHRNFNVDEKEVQEKILQSIYNVSKEMNIVFPIHPRTKKRIAEFKLEKYLEHVTCIEPLNYYELISLIQTSYKVITDSGVIQKEAYFCGKEALIIMPDTAWKELIINKFNILVDDTNIYCEALKKPNIIKNMKLYGEGDSARRIVEIILDDYKKREVL